MDEVKIFPATAAEAAELRAAQITEADRVTFDELRSIADGLTLSDADRHELDQLGEKIKQ